MPARSIILRCVRQHNLKGFDVEFPHGQLTVVTGPSGSGKSSLAFDTLYAEGQRRYVESLSTYAKQFLERMARPAVDRVEGIAPAVAIEQKNPVTSSRSTVGTATEVWDYLRLLWARAGHPTCHQCGGDVLADTPQSAAAKVAPLIGPDGAVVAFPLPRSERSTHALVADNLRAMGFLRVILPGEHDARHLDELPPTARLDRDGLLVVVDRLRGVTDGDRRLVESIGSAFDEGDGVAIVRCGRRELRYTREPRCLACGTSAPRLSPALFSFNNPAGACPGCNGFGAVLEYDEGLIVPDPSRTLAEGALDPWTKPRYEARRRLLKETARREDIPWDQPWSRLKATQRRFLLHGKAKRFVGMVPFLEALEAKRYKQYVRIFLRQYQRAQPCPACAGGRLRPEALAVHINDRTIADIAALTTDELAVWLDDLRLPAFQREIAAPVLTELVARVMFLRDVGLGYLTMDRQARTLSGGETQRINLANALGSRLTDTLYVLDEPSIGLHPRDTDRLLGLLLRLRTAGNTVVVVEHDPATIRAADHMIELGPGSGDRGGELVYAGPVAGASSRGTLTGQYLSGARAVPLPARRRRAGPRWLTLEGATLHNVVNQDVAIPLGTLTVVTGVSGSGKSTLVHDILYRRLAERLGDGHGAKEHLGEQVGAIRRMGGADHLSDVVLVDQSPIGRTPRSNPVTYVRAFDEIRALFAAQPLAKARGYTPATFSFNTAGGRCDSCEGAGHVQVEMVFLADVFVPCEACGGRRFLPTVLDVRIKGLSIADVLDLSVEEAMVRFRHQEKLGKALWQLQQVGLGYLRLGQPATTLSGGEAQRLKIARRLVTGGTRSGRLLYILDEPTTGLHLEDVRTLVKVLDRLVDDGHTVLVIEHHLDVIKRADWLIDMGPDGGPAGGRVVGAGTPEVIAASDTPTGRALKPVLAPLDAAAR
ncbi:MAG: excinuclease ABC subunit UvrA [Gemmatimonadales bacterium]